MGTDVFGSPQNECNHKTSTKERTNVKTVKLALRNARIIQPEAILLKLVWWQLVRGPAGASIPAMYYQVPGIHDEQMRVSNVDDAKQLGPISSSLKRPAYAVHHPNRFSCFVLIASSTNASMFKTATNVLFKTVANVLLREFLLDCQTTYTYSNSCIMLLCYQMSCIQAGPAPVFLSHYSIGAIGALLYQVKK